MSHAEREGVTDSLRKSARSADLGLADPSSRHGVRDLNEKDLSVPERNRKKSDEPIHFVGSQQDCEIDTFAPSNCDSEKSEISDMKQQLQACRSNIASLYHYVLDPQVSSWTAHWQACGSVSNRPAIYTGCVIISALVSPRCSVCAMVIRCFIHFVFELK